MSASSANFVQRGGHESAPSVLVIDESRASGRVSMSLIDRIGLCARWTGGLPEVIAVLEREPADLLVLDIPAGRALAHAAFIVDLRRRGDGMGIIVLSAEHDTDSKALMLRAGADDYMTRPFAVAEFEGRVLAVLRRAVAPRTLVRFAGRLILDPASRTVRFDGRPVGLGPREFSILWMLASRAGRTIGTARIGETVLGADDAAARAEIHVLVNTTRLKLRALGGPLELATRRGVGYTLIIGR